MVKVYHVISKNDCIFFEWIMKNFLRLQRVLSNWCSCPFQNPRAIPSGISAAHDRQHRVAFLQRQWFFHCLCFCFWASLPTVGFIRLHTASHSFPSYSLPFKKREKKNKNLNHLKPFIYKEKGQTQTQIQLQLFEWIWILAWVRRRKKGKKTRWTHWARGGPERVTSERGKIKKREKKENKKRKKEIGRASCRERV